MVFLEISQNSQENTWARVASCKPKAAIKRNNSNQLNEKVNRTTRKLLPDMKHAVLQTKDLQTKEKEMYFEFDTINSFKEYLTNVHAIKNTIWTMKWIAKEICCYGT